ncbi:hypothetical protein HK104_003973, partial [Borealophlyctis nickersoniae]
MSFKQLFPALLVLLASTFTAAQTPLARLEPPDGKLYLAFWIDMDPREGADLPYLLNARTGLQIPVFQFGQSIPVKNTLNPNRMANQTNEGLLRQTGTNAAIYITLYPTDGLDAVTDQEIGMLVDQLAGYAKLNISTWLRFAPEMNGNWMAYSQTPSLYRSTWIRIARALRAGAPNVAMVFSPNMGYTAISNPPARTSDDFRLLDTNGDGVLDATDDPYLPYYPGDEWVDWVGLSVYHFAYERPNLDNVPPTPGEFEQHVNTVSLFYQNFAVGRNKPMMISESAAAYNPTIPLAGGLTEVSLKQAFWRQYMTNTTFLDAYPKLKFICHFEISKLEDIPPEPRVRDFRLTVNADVRDAWVKDMDGVKGR